METHRASKDAIGTRRRVNLAERIEPRGDYVLGPYPRARVIYDCQPLAALGPVSGLRGETKKAEGDARVRARGLDVCK